MLKRIEELCAIDEIDSIKISMDAFKKFFKLPAHIEPMALIVLGYGAETPEPDPDRFKKEKIHFQTW